MTKIHYYNKLLNIWNDGLYLGNRLSQGWVWVHCFFIIENEEKIRSFLHPLFLFRIEINNTLNLQIRTNGQDIHQFTSYSCKREELLRNDKIAYQKNLTRLHKTSKNGTQNKITKQIKTKQDNNLKLKSTLQR